jgi:hypothetical protein
MLGRLESQLALLSEYSQNAFQQGRPEFLPEVATKLRLLVVRSRQNIPLLLEVAYRVKLPLTVTLGGPPGMRSIDGTGAGDEMSLDAFFDLQAMTIYTSTGLVSMTKRELIRAASEQLGGAHADWAVSEALLNAVSEQILIGGMTPAALELRGCARASLAHGARVVARAHEVISENALPPNNRCS